MQQDFVKAAEYYEAAVLRGVAQAQYNLGVMFDEAIGVKQALLSYAEICIHFSYIPAPSIRLPLPSALFKFSIPACDFCVPSVDLCAFDLLTELQSTRFYLLIVLIVFPACVLSLDLCCT